MILAVEVVSICATLVPMIRAKRRHLARLKNGRTAHWKAPRRAIP
jgi:hypothetical protein